MDAQAEAFLRDFIDYAVAKFDDIFLERFVPGRVVQHLPDDSGVAGAQDIVLRNTHQIADSKTRH